MKIETIAIIGAGNLGREIAEFALRGGYRVVLEDVSVTALEWTIAAIQKRSDAHLRASRIDAVSRDTSSSRLSAAHSAESAIREADLIIETVADELEMKLELFTIFDKFAKPGALLASTTHSLSIDDLADMTFCTDRCVGMRFLGGAGNVRCLELVRGRATSDRTAEICREVGLRMGLQVTELHNDRAIPAGNDQKNSNDAQDENEERPL